MIPFTAPQSDILFSMREVAQATSLTSWDDDLAVSILEAFSAFAEGELSPLNEVGDRQGACLADGKVRMPDGFTDAYAQLSDMGWQGLSSPEEFGGMEQSPLIAALVSEVFSGANHAMQMVCNLVPGAVSTLLAYGTDTQKAEWIPRMASGDVLSTMCLTEPGAGSDLSRIRTKAIPDGNDWRLSGEKIFISGGDQNMSKDILHLVLARTGAVDDGVKGLSLFLTGKAMAGPSIKIARIEEKLGLHASPTCQMVFDDCPAQLLGQEGGGLKAMFTAMNHARLDVASQGVAHASRAHSIAEAYADERKQGQRKGGTPVTLSEHADVRRMLDEQRALAMGARSMVHLTTVEMVLGEHPALVDFLTPICKIFGTQAGVRAADLGIQTLGGYGYLEEYGLSQTWRDARITPIYEGTNGILALTTATRSLRAGDGAGPDAFAAFIIDLSQEDHVSAALASWENMRAQVMSAPDPSQLAHEFTRQTCSVFFQAVWSRISALKNDPDTGRIAERVRRGMSLHFF